MHLGRRSGQKETSRIHVRLRKSLIKLLSLTILTLMMIPALPVHAAPAYLPGAHVGDSVTYGEVSGNSSPFNVTSSLVLTVTSVIGATVVADLKFNFRDGTSQVMTFSSNVQNSQSGNGSFLIIAGGLSAGELLTPTASPSSFFGFVTETVSRVYAGALRSTNEEAFSQNFNGQTSSIAFYWDQTSGLLVELSEYLIGQGPSGQTAIAHIKATSTNICTPSTVADFGFDAISQTSPFFYLGQSTSYTLNLTSFQAFSGKVGLSASLTNASLAQPPTLSLGASIVNVASNGFATTTLTFSTNSSTKLGAYLFSVHGVSESIAHDALFAVSSQPPSFALFATPANLKIGV